MLANFCSLRNTIYVTKDAASMRSTLLLLIVACVHAGNSGIAQAISFSVKNAPIQQVFILIEKKAGVSFFYKVESLKKARKISMKVKNASLAKVLQLCFQGQPLTYEVFGKTIVVKEKPVSNFQAASPSTTFPPSPNVSGQ